MLVFVPVGLGVIIGIIFIVITYFLKKYQSTYTKLPPFLSLLSSVVIFIISFQVRGFEGAAYGILAITLLFFTPFIFAMSSIGKKRMHSCKQWLTVLSINC